MSDLISRSALLERIDRYGDVYALEIIQEAPAVDAVDREKLIKKLFPMGVPLTREDWNYAINASAVYAAIMGDLVEPECKTINVRLDGLIEIHSYGEKRSVEHD